MLRRRQSPQPRRRPTSSATALVAAARKVDEPTGAEIERRAKRVEEWQTRCFEYMAQIPEVEYSARYFGDAFARMRLYVGTRTDPNSDPNPLKPEPEADEDYTPAEVEACAEVLAELTSPEGGQSEIQRRFGVQLAMPGEAYLVGRPVSQDSVESRWDVYSLRELGIETTNTTTEDGRPVFKYRLRRRGQTAGGSPLPNETVAARIWRPDAEYSQEAVSPMRAAEAILEELLTLTKSIQAGALSRVAGPGILGMPNSMRPPAVNPNDDETNGQAPAADNVVADLLAVAAAALDPASAAARVPMMVWMDDELWEKWSQDKLITWGRDIDTIAAEQRAELIRRFAAVIDIPAEVLTGMGDVKYWNLEYIGAEGFRAHIEPAVVIMDDGLTRTYLRPALEARGIERVERFWIWHDPGSLVADPDKADLAKLAHDAYTISDARFRDDLGYSDEDAPDAIELFRRLTIASAAAGRPPVLTDPAMLDEEAPMLPEQPALAAAATDHDDDLDLLLDRYAEMDIGLLLWTQQLADGAMHRALERASAKIVRAAAKDKAAVDVLGNVPSLLIAGTRGPSWVERLPDGGDLFVDVFLGIRDAYVRRITRVGEEALLLALKHASPDGTLDDLRAEAYRIELAQDADASWEMLHAALIEDANRLLFSPAPEGPPGEVDGALVSAGVVRLALGRAGGSIEDGLVAARMTAKRKSETIGPRPTSMLTSDRFHRVLDEAGIVVTRWEWRYGDPSLRVSAFEPHMRLNRKRFHFWDDEVLMNTGGFPKADHFWPMDHKGCLCSVVRARAQRKSRR